MLKISLWNLKGQLNHLPVNVYIYLENIQNQSVCFYASRWGCCENIIIFWRKKEFAAPLLYVYYLTLFICDTSSYEHISSMKYAQIVRYCYVTVFLHKYPLWYILKTSFGLATRLYLCLFSYAMFDDAQFLKTVQYGHSGLPYFMHYKKVL